MALSFEKCSCPWLRKFDLRPRVNLKYAFSYLNKVPRSGDCTLGELFKAYASSIKTLYVVDKPASIDGANMYVYVALDPAVYKVFFKSDGDYTTGKQAGNTRWVPYKIEFANNIGYHNVMRRDLSSQEANTGLMETTFVEGRRANDGGYAKTGAEVRDGVAPSGTADTYM